MTLQDGLKIQASWTRGLAEGLHLVASWQIPGDCILQTGGFGGPGEDGADVGTEELIGDVDADVETGGGWGVVEEEGEPGAEETVQGDCRRLWRRAPTILSLERKRKMAKSAAMCLKCCIVFLIFDTCYCIRRGVAVFVSLLLLTALSNVPNALWLLLAILNSPRDESEYP